MYMKNLIYVFMNLAHLKCKQMTMSTMSLSEIWLGPKKEVKSERTALKFIFIPFIL